MISTQTFENYPEFANAGQKSQPNDAKYAAGFIPSDVLPAEWLNWFLSGATKGVTALNTGVKSIEQEINAVLTSRSVTPDINTTKQLLTVLNKIKAEAVLAAHPVGSLYWTSKKEDPAVTFGGGTWKQITDKFVLAAGSTYKAESTDGAATVTLSVSNLPGHRHSFTPSGTVISTFTGEKHIHTFTPKGTVSYTTAKGAIKGGAYKFSGTQGTTIESGEHKHTISNMMLETPHTEAHGPGRFGSWGSEYTSANGKHSHLFTPAGSISVTTNPTFTGESHNHSFTGYQIETSATQGGTVKSTFTGNFETTEITGDGDAFSILPPYVVKYCWERTA
ncbi:phage baseplate protein [Treponema sp.]|uniref:phage baseplate protein n=1 Tax=Treponema sp. TaxID=166 RepID=UPI003FD82EC8